MILKDLLSIFRGETHLQGIGDDFSGMLDQCKLMFEEVNVAFWNGNVSEELRNETYKRDIKLNKSERAIRKIVFSHLTTHSGSTADTPYCLVLMNVVKDAERIGDYIKNLAEIPVISTTDIPEGDIRNELHTIGDETQKILNEFGPVFRKSKRGQAEKMIRAGRQLTHRVDGLLPRVANSSFSSQAAVSAALTARFYKRIIAHAVNILSTVIMPIHKIDFFDEEEIQRLSSPPESTS
jgi:phosphate transport system protein